MDVFPGLRRLDPRRRLAARLLVALFLAFAVPGALLVLLLDRRLAALQELSEGRFSAVRLAQETMRVQQDADDRAQWIDRATRVAEEAAWSLAAIAEAALLAPGPARGDGSVPPPDAHGHVWNASEAKSLAYISRPRSADPRARRDLTRTHPLEPQMEALLRRIPAVRTVSVWTASGTMRISPRLDLHEAIERSGGALDAFVFNRNARFPESRPPTGDRTVWTPAFMTPRLAPEARSVSLFVPMRDAEGALIGAVALDLDPRRAVTEAVERGGMPGDVWFATDALGHGVLMPARAAELLRWQGEPTETLAESPDPERQRLARATLAQDHAIGSYRLRGKTHRLASARTGAAGWIFYEGLSAEALQRIADETDSPVESRMSELRREVVLLFVALGTLVFGVVFFAARRISAPIKGLVRVAEEIGHGHEHAEVESPRSQDEVGRLAAAIQRMGTRVERRVEALHRLHSLLRAAEPTADLAEVQARATEAIATFTGAERVWFLLHDPGTNRLEAAWPGWNLPKEMARELKISADSPSIPGMVFRTGEIYVSNDLEHDPYSSPKLREFEGNSGIFAPLKSEGRTIGVVGATNRPGGFGPEEADALIIFADAASLLIQNARLYEALSGTVTELRRASRLKDHFLQNVNHELRTPLTSIVGWTDIFEGEVPAETLQRGLRQIKQSSRLLLALIDDLLDLARLERGTLSLEWKPVSLEEIVSRAIETVRLMADARGVKLLEAPLPEPTLTVRADPLRLQQILWNLLVNAIRFTPRYGRVVVRVEREPEKYLVSVEDDGVGIPEGELPHVFERFRQVDGSATRRHAGMGIGLSLARSLVELHGGAIWAESTVGQGSRFTFSLPVQAARRSTDSEVVAGGARENGRERERKEA